jgi:phosphatidylserine decarboxylase
MVFVGALNVGQMVFEFEPRVETNKDTEEIKVYEYENIKIDKHTFLTLLVSDSLV